MEPDPLFDRLQRAVSPDYRLERELARGGMGIVFLAHDVTLKCPVAVKVLRLEIDTAFAADAFTREAQILASVRHPNVATIHHAFGREGLHYYIMEFIEGPTLAERLERGPLTPQEAVKLGRDLLDGLESVHLAGVVHRDIKPSNVFLLPNRAVLADFGIARAPTTEPRRRHQRSADSNVGTPGYMAPEQIAGDPITPQTDLYLVGMVIYEAITGRRFPPYPEHPSWNGVPRAIARVLRRATRDHPADRWSDARAFRKALWRTRTVRYLVRAAMMAVGGVVVGVAAMIAIALMPPSGVSPGAVAVVLPRFDYVGTPARQPIADSLVALVRTELRTHPDFGVTDSRPWLLRARPSLVFRGRMEVVNETIRVRLTVVPMRNSETTLSEVQAPVADWASLRDSLTYRILVAVWDAKSPLARSLPVAALPHTPGGLARFLEAEQRVAAGAWSDAYDAYAKAEATDSTCWLCSWRLSEVERWLSRERDPARVRRYVSHINAFPPWYQSLIRAQQLPLEARLDTLRAETTHWDDFFLGWFQLGDELFHRGPLAGHTRGEAVPALERAARLRPDFAPAWEHLAWVEIAEGDSTGAVRALDSLDRRHAIADPYAQTLRRLLGLGFAWRFLPDADALAQTRSAVADPVAGASPELAAGPRLLGSFDAPRGEVAFGELLEASPAHDLRRSGLIAQVFGALALGRPIKALALAQHLADVSPERETARFSRRLESTLALLDPEGISARPILARAASSDSGSDPFSRTIAQMIRAQQRAMLGDSDGARRMLLWHEHTDIVGLPTGLPQAAEVDWAFGTLARWRLATLLAASGERAAACRAYRDVVRLWSEGEPLYRARADTARHRVRDLHCSVDRA